MTPKERHALSSGIELTAGQLSDEIERLENELDDANEVIDTMSNAIGVLKDEIDTLNARIAEAYRRRREALDAANKACAKIDTLNARIAELEKSPS